MFEIIVDLDHHIMNLTVSCIRNVVNTGLVS